MRAVAWTVLALALVGGLGLVALVIGTPGRLETAGEVTRVSRPAAVVAVRGRAGTPKGAGAPARQILFGDLHVHTTFSMDAFLHSLPLMQGEGAHPPADACDFARFCAGLDFFSLTDHAEGLTPDQWRESRESVRQCNQVAGDTRNPDLVAYLGWEWTQMSASPRDHYGHKNVILRDLEEERIPARPIAARGAAFDTMRQRSGRGFVLLMSLWDLPHRQRYFDFGALRQVVRATPVCEAGVPVRELPPDCAEAVATPRELFAKLDEWGVEALVIPHGNAWGTNTPAGVSWQGQLAAGQHDPGRQTLIEVYSGHGNSEEIRAWRHRRRGASGEAVCPEPSDGFTPPCWRAGEIIRERCEAAALGPEECERRAARTRERSLAAGRGGRFVVPGQRADDWLDAGQCTDCFQPAFDYRPGGSVQAALATSGPDAAGGFRFGLIASSDTHFARPASGYKEFTPHGMTDAWGTDSARVRRWIEPGGDPSSAESVAIDPERILLLPGGDVERSASFYYTGGTVAVHSAGRGREAIWEALRRREVYGTSGPRLLLWFDLLNPPPEPATSGPAAPAPAPMGSEVRMDAPPRFRVRALGAFRQRPGCPPDVQAALGPERLELLCMGECYHPADERHRITRIEVVRIHPRRDPGEDLMGLVEDPWRVLPCPESPAGCEVTFEDPEFVRAGRDAVYYVRAVQEPTPQVNGEGLRCETDAEGRCVSVRPCRPGEEDCLARAEARAWSSPIFVDSLPGGDG